jgi:predicted DNA-binding transcriptional regulator YafY
MRADRLLALLLLLQARGRMTAQELARRLEVSERTIYRDVSALGIAGVPVYAERGPGGGCTLAEGYRTNLTGLTEAEARTLCMSFMSGAPALLRDLGLGQALDDALLKLLAALPSRQRAHAERARARIYVDPAGWSSAEEEVPHLATIQEAVWSDRQLRLVYCKPEGEVSARVVDPLGLVAKASIWYLVAGIPPAHHGIAGISPAPTALPATGDPATESAELRVFRISRVHAATVLDRPCHRPAGFDLAAYWAAASAEFQASWRRYEVRLRVAPELLPVLAQLYPARYAAIMADAVPPNAAGSITITLAFDSLEAARTHVLGLGSGAEVLEPHELRASVAEFAAEIAALYIARDRDDGAPTPG